MSGLGVAPVVARLVLVGMALVALGVGLVSIPAGVATAGVELIVAGVVVDLLTPDPPGEEPPS